MSTIAEMRLAKEKLERARAQMEEALSALRPIANKAHAEGYTISSIAIALGVTRQTVYNILEEEVVE